MFARNSAGAHEMSMEELRASFSMAASAYDRARAFRSERGALIDALETPIPIVPDPDRLVLHLVPLSAFGGPGSKIDLNRAGALLTQLSPIGAHGGFNSRINYEGFITYRPTDPSHGYTQLFRNGVVEAVFTDIVRESQRYSKPIPGQAIEQYVVEVVPSYLEALRLLEVSTPVLMMLTLQNVKGATYVVGDDQWMFGQPNPINKATLELPESVVENFGSVLDYHRALRPIFDVLWNAAGFREAGFFDEQGRWTGRWQSR